SNHAVPGWRSSFPLDFARPCLLSFSFNQIRNCFDRPPPRTSEEHSKSHVELDQGPWGWQMSADVLSYEDHNEVSRTSAVARSSANSGRAEAGNCRTVAR